MKRLTPKQHEVFAVAEAFLADRPARESIAQLAINGAPGPDGRESQHDLVVGTYKMGEWRVLEVKQRDRPRYAVELGVVVMLRGIWRGLYARERCACEECDLVGLDTAPDALDLLERVGDAMSTKLRLVKG